MGPWGLIGARRGFCGTAAMVAQGGAPTLSIGAQSRSFRAIGIAGEVKQAAPVSIDRGGVRPMVELRQARGSDDLGARMGFRVNQLHGGVHRVTKEVIGPSSSSEVARNSWDNLGTAAPWAHGCVGLANEIGGSKASRLVRSGAVHVPRRGEAHHGGGATSTGLDHERLLILTLLQMDPEPKPMGRPK